MKKKLLMSVALGMVLSGMVPAAQAITKDVYQVGSTYEIDGKYGAYDAWDAFIPGSPTIDISITADFTGWATLSITAEGVDAYNLNDPEGENDQVWFGTAESLTHLGDLNQQDFYWPLYNLNKGEGAMTDGSTAITATSFNVQVNAGTEYFIKIITESGNWVNEIETVSLTPVPEPTTMLLLGTGLAGLAALGRKRRS